MSNLPDDWRGRFVERDQAGVIKAAYGCPQPGAAEEPLADDDPELAAFLAPKPIPPDPRDEEIADLKAAVAALKKTGVLTDAMIDAEKEPAVIDEGIKAAGAETLRKA